ncbi:MAG TPA: LCP family protein [Anaerolineales bacterium]|nr:LCP family protein [Anaerolineales bacterium]
MKRIVWMLSIAGFALLLGATIFALTWLRRPLGPALALEVPPEAQARQAAEAQVAPQAQKTCGNSGVMRLVVIGRASPSDHARYGADAVRLALLDFDAPAAAILALPNELWVSSPALAEQGFEQTSLNMVYQTAWENAKGNPDHVRAQKATQALAQTIVANFEFVPDHYVTVEEAPFIEYIDALGGVEVNLAQAVDGSAEGYGSYPQGVQVLTGLRALNLTRLMHPSGQPEADIWGSLGRQDAVLQGLRDTALKLGNVAKIPELVKAMRKAITTDLSVDQALDLACMVQEVGSEAVLLVVGPELVRIDEQGRMIPDVEGIKALIAEMGGGS